jgi:hypothetical protein
MIEASLLIGISGMLLILAGFILNLSHKLNVKSPIYLWLNIIGCILLFYYAIILKSLPFAVLQAVWGLAALIKLVFKR